MVVDYTNEGFVLPIELEDVRGYASVNHMMYAEEDGLAVTGDYFIYLLHPKWGSTHFRLDGTGGNVRPYIKDGGAIWVEGEMVQQIIDAIEFRKKIILNNGQD